MSSPARGAPTVELVTTLDRMGAFEGDWKRLEAAAGTSRPIFFQTYGWVRHVAALRMQHGSRHFLSPLIAVWSRDGAVVAILPLGIVRTGICRIAVALDDPFGQMSCILCEPAEDVGALVGLLFDTLRAERTVDAVRLAKVVPSSPLFAALSAQDMHQTVEYGTVVIDLHGYKTPSDYHRSLSRKARRTQRNSWNRLHSLGEVSTLVADDRPAIADIISRSIDSRYGWMVSLGKTAPAFRDPAYLPTLLALAGQASADVRLIGFELKLGETSLALQWGFLHANRYYAYISSRNFELNELSSGRLHLEAIVGICIERGISIVEIMSPAATYKLQLGGRVVPITDFEMPITKRGYLIVKIWRQRVRPAIKSGYEALPSAWRGRINDMLHPSARNSSTDT